MAAFLLYTAALLAPECLDCAAPPRARMPAVIVSDSRKLDRLAVVDNATRIDVVELRQFKPGLDLVEALAEVPGLVARDRFNFAQDTQISVRGFGARSAFGVRGVRIEYDGIPATAADGQSQVGHLNMEAVTGVEVVRGPFAALYGNGGAYIRLDRDLSATDAASRLSVGAGSDQQARVSVASRGGNALRYDVSANHFRTDGHRAHSAAQRSLLDARVEHVLGENGRLSYSVSYQDQPQSLDPQGLTRIQFERDPGASSPSATAFNTRKSATQRQLGIGYRHNFGATQFEALSYGGQRQIEQFLSVPVGAQRAATSGGGVIDLKRDFSGWGVRAVRETAHSFGDLRLSAEWRAELLDEARLGYENFVGNQLGVRGVLRRDEDNRARVNDAILRADWSPNPSWTASAGVRRNRSEYRSADRFITPANPDDSGRYDSAAWLPVAGIHYRVNAYLDLRAAGGRSHETPTLAELAYRSAGDGGFNAELKPTRARQWELGASLGDVDASVEVTVFRIDSEDEIVALSTQGGRSSFRNAGGTRRQGIEFAGDWSWSDTWRLRAVLSYLDARYGKDEPAQGLAIVAGRRIPGIAARQALLELLWRPDQNWSGALELRALDDSAASDRNDDRVPGYAALNLRLNRAFQWRDHRVVTAQLRVDNLLDQSYSASLIVNDANQRYFEPAPGRRIWLGLDMRFQ